MKQIKKLLLLLVAGGFLSIPTFADKNDNSENLNLDQGAADGYYPYYSGTGVSDGLCLVYDPYDPDCYSYGYGYGYPYYGYGDGYYGYGRGYRYGRRHGRYRGHGRHHRGYKGHRGGHRGGHKGGGHRGGHRGGKGGHR